MQQFRLFRYLFCSTLLMCAVTRAQTFNAPDVKLPGSSELGPSTYSASLPAVQQQISDILVAAPSAGFSYYGMYSLYPIGASFQLAKSAYVSTIDVVLHRPAPTTFPVFDVSLQTSLTSGMVLASAALSGPAGVSTQTLNVNATLPAGTYYVVVHVPGYAGTPVTPGYVDGWMMSNGAYEGTVTDGLFSSRGPGSGWAFLSGDYAGTGVMYRAPAFTVHGGDATNVTSQLIISVAVFSPTRTGRQATDCTVITVINPSTPMDRANRATGLAGPLSVVLTNLSSNATLVNPAGTLAGNPYVLLQPSALPPGGQASASLCFLNPTGLPITFVPVIYSAPL